MPDPDPDLSTGEPRRLRFTLRQRLQMTLVSWIVPAIVWLIGATLRITITFEEGAIQRLEDGYPGIYPFWHRCVFPAMWIFRRYHPAVMTSRSRDGEYIARVIRRFGFPPVRGSSSHGGHRALLEMNRLIRQGQAVAFPIDGPRGPRFIAKKGPVLLARMSGTHISALYLAVERAWVLHSWDRLMIPKPFSRVYVRFARKIFVPQDADDAAMDRYYGEMQAALERVTTFAEAQFSGSSTAART